MLACLLTLPLDTAMLFTEEILESSSHLGMCLAYYNSSSRGTYIHIRTPRTMALPMRDSLNSQSTVSQQSVIQSPQTQLFDSSPCAYRSQLNVNKSPGYLGKNELNHFSWGNGSLNLETHHNTIHSRQHNNSIHHQSSPAQSNHLLVLFYIPKLSATFHPSCLSCLSFLPVSKKCPTESHKGKMREGPEGNGWLCSRTSPVPPHSSFTLSTFDQFSRAVSNKVMENREYPVSTSWSRPLPQREP